MQTTHVHCTCVFQFLCICVCMCLHACTYTLYTCVWVCVPVCVCVCVFMSACILHNVHWRVYMHRYVHCVMYMDHVCSVYAFVGTICANGRQSSCTAAPWMYMAYAALSWTFAQYSRNTSHYKAFILFWNFFFSSLFAAQRQLHVQIAVHKWSVTSCGNLNFL